MVFLDRLRRSLLCLLCNRRRLLLGALAAEVREGDAARRLGLACCRQGAQAGKKRSLKCWKMPGQTGLDGKRKSWDVPPIFDSHIALRCAMVPVSAASDPRRSDAGTSTGLLKSKSLASCTARRREGASERDRSTPLVQPAHTGRRQRWRASCSRRPAPASDLYIVLYMCRSNCRNAHVLRPATGAYLEGLAFARLAAHLAGRRVDGSNAVTDHLNRK